MSSRKPHTRLRQMMADLNAASRKKEHLVKRVTEVLRVPLAGAETIKTMMSKGIQAVHDMAEPAPQNAVGFGKHSG